MRDTEVAIRVFNGLSENLTRHVGKNPSEAQEKTPDGL
jgi:hypothetical protein